jgi:hypothetical protein
MGHTPNKLWNALLMRCTAKTETKQWCVHACLAVCLLRQPAGRFRHALHKNTLILQLTTACVSVCHVLSNLQAYDDLCAKLRELDALSGINGLLSWDELVSFASTDRCSIIEHCLL